MINKINPYIINKHLFEEKSNSNHGVNSYYRRHNNGDFEIYCINEITKKKISLEHVNFIPDVRREGINILTEILK